jgi:hypothetical protein
MLYVLWVSESHFANKATIVITLCFFVKHLNELTPVQQDVEIGTYVYMKYRSTVYVTLTLIFQFFF